MPAYDSTAHRPPAPVALVSVRLLNGTVTVSNVPMLIDSGADVSLLPMEFVGTLIELASITAQYEVEGFDGTKSLADALQFELQFLGKSFKGQFLVANSACGILGRNILNCISILLDGPALAWSEQPKRK